MQQDQGHIPFSLIHYLSILGTQLYLRPAATHWHHRFLPPNTSAWWGCASPHLTLRPVPDVTSIHGTLFPSLHVAHKADVVRLTVLLREGGVYLDSDVIPLRSFEELRRLGEGGKCVMGLEEAPGQVGLANAVILSPANASFLRRWWDRYKDFAPAKSWAFHSVLLPRELALANPTEITTLSGAAFFTPVWTQLAELYVRDDGYNFVDNFALHLWTSQETKAYGGLKELTVQAIWSGNGSFHRVARQVLRDAEAAGLLCAEALPLPRQPQWRGEGGGEGRRKWGGNRG